MNKKDSEEFYGRLREQLWENTKWPSKYLYKFIVPTDRDKIEQVHAVFDNTGAVIESKQSKKGTYTSISITVQLNNPNEVIEKYKEVSVIDGIISL
jgi:putative lipoic acid-binding regulatory protein